AACSATCYSPRPGARCRLNQALPEGRLWVIDGFMLKIVSGGQTGVDRAALDAAIERGVLYGGWGPKGGRGEDMPTPPGLPASHPYLQETPLADPNQRTEWN